VLSGLIVIALGTFLMASPIDWRLNLGVWAAERAVTAALKRWGGSWR
jgi:hypothetical protein